VTEFQLKPEPEEFKLGFDFEHQARSEGFTVIAGIDEVGRGCLAGPVVAAACVLDLDRPWPTGLNDSKKLTAKQRDEIDAELRETALCFAVGQIEAEEIDRINILQATMMAMAAAVANLTTAPHFLLIDAVKLREIAIPQRSIIKGDAISASIAAASVIATVYRDRLMHDYPATYPQYGFREHVGYATKTHRDAIRVHGPTPIHRRSFRGVCDDAPQPAEI
jgi:ribonuclease HII